MGHRERSQHLGRSKLVHAGEVFGLEIDFLGGNFELIPFGGGRRICPGLPLAMRMLNLMLGSLINSFDHWKVEDRVVPETLNMEEKFGITLAKAQPLIPVPMLYKNLA
ncbi:geraniol 8-hydroxylase-like [Pyrus ussuriensis x Pyrus communis]|uniref:Geraniol 8-hydroxylase-like n=1 Tax=Pyrus ussuriensis x Pyrus communis TaxID=2448454 RepID=A0A5N5HEA1_9ROSA|nr:geraniol 8-hydroxylase-like [Pyrus ussuriensis x Pyrus communis]